MAISGDWPLLEYVYLNKYSLPTQPEWKFTFRSVKSARSDRNAYREKLKYFKLRHHSAEVHKDIRQDLFPG